ncbi:hypothetical protein L7F22_023793 [Adiantum nelumboides]|nr:hypothetical protein [Adiantum nelumboides]
MASSGAVKEECFRPVQFPVKIEPELHATTCVVNGAPVVDISSSSSSSGGDGRGRHGTMGNTTGKISSPPAVKRSSSLVNQTVEDSNPSAKRPRLEKHAGSQSTPVCRGKDLDSSLPDDFLQPLAQLRQSSPAPQAVVTPPLSVARATAQNTINKSFRQFWKAGDYESDKSSYKARSGGMDHVRVHPKFLHSNATSHKWALGAVAELLDNALDEVVHGATFVKVDMIKNPKNGEPMLLIEDDGGGMNPDSMRQCMSLGYSAKSKIANTIGQYGNGFKTSTMRLGADVVVFSRCQQNKGLGPTESIGMLSYTFLRETGQEDIIVPMIDYEIQPFGLRKLLRSSVEDWNRNMNSIQHWSPYSTEAELMDHFKGMKKQGTKIIIYNLWEDDQGQLELDFDSNRCDIQLRGVNRDEKHILMAERFPNSQHYLTYQHSLRIYASILYLKLPPGFRMFLRGKELEHHNLIDDLMFTEVWTYRPVASDVETDSNNMKAVVTVGFVKDAKEHIDVQGFNVYHKNRLIKPFWRLWNSAASRGRGIIGVLEANFVEPAHDKQGFERTIVLARLEARLIEMQKTYWSKHCHKVGYVNNTVIGKEAKAAEQKGATLAMQSTLAVSATVAPSAKPSSPEASRLATLAGYVSGVPVTPGLARSQQLQAQVQARKAKEVNLQLMRQGGALPAPMQAVSACISPQRPNFPTGNHAARPSSSQLIHTQYQERLPGLAHIATRSPLPPPTLSRVSTSQPEVVRQVSALTGAEAALRSRQSGTAPALIQNLPVRNSASVGDVRAQFPRLGQETCRPVASSIGPNSAQNLRTQPLGPAGETSRGIQNSRVCSTTSIGDARAQPSGPGEEALRPAFGGPQSILRESAAVQSFKLSSPSSRVDSYAPKPSHSFVNHVLPSTQDSSVLLANEGSKSPATGACAAGGKEQLVDEQDVHDGQILPIPTSFIASKGQSTVQELSAQGESHRVEELCTPATARVSGPPHQSVGTEANVSQVAQLSMEQGPLKFPRLNNKEPALVRKSLEDLGRMFAKKAASITINQGDQSKGLKAPEADSNDSVVNIRSIVETCTTQALVKTDTNQQLEARLVDLEVEVQNLQQRLDALKGERDSLRHQLLEERLRGQSSKQELQRKVEQTWAKVRELEAKNGRLQLTQEGIAGVRE